MLRATAQPQEEPMQDASWVDRAAYPFEPRYFEIDGARMHYVDEGQGEPIVMLHGTPTWSFLYRDVIKTLAPHYRCIVPDHLGFGLSDKPERGAYHPKDHAQRLQALIEHLQLRDLTLVVHDFGGPIGLSYAAEHPSNVRALVLFNTWMWSLRGELVAEFASRSSNGPIGKFFFRQFNVELRTVFKAVWGDSSKLTAALYQQYVKPFPKPSDREAMRVLAHELLYASGWYEELWKRSEHIKDIPSLLLWGLKDPIFKQRHLARWQTLLAHAQTITFPEAGHFVQEEERDKVGLLVKQFLATQSVEVEG